MATMSNETAAAFSNMSAAVTNMLNSYSQNGIQLIPGTTACAVISTENKLYTAISHVEMLNGMPHASHSERDVLTIMAQYNDPVMQYILLMDVSTGRYMIPCNICIDAITAAHPGNTNCIVVLPTEAVAFTEISRSASVHSNPYAAANPIVTNPMHTTATSGSGSSSMSAVLSVKEQAENADDSVIKSKMNKLRQIVNEEPLLPEDSPRRKKFKLF